jgi:hypothetical protein
MPRHVRRAAAAALALLAAGLGACDPCAGVVHCSRGNYLAVDGQIVEPANGAGIDGVRIDVVRVGGLPLATDSLTTVTSGGGHWRVELSPSGAGAVSVAIAVAVPGYPPYRVPGVVLETREHAGDATVLDPWIPVPYFSFVGEFFLNGTTDQRVEGAVVEFRRTSGVALRGDGIVDGVYRTTTDAGGRFAIFPTDKNVVLPATVAGDVVGDFFVQLPAPYGTSTIRGVTFTATPVFRKFPAIFRYAIGPGVP